MANPNPYAAPTQEPLTPLQQEPFGFGGGGMTADLSARFWGAMIDRIISVIFVVIGVVIGFAVIGMDSIEEGDELMIQGIAYLSLLPVGLVQWYLIATSGQSIGKKVMKTKIVKLDGSEAGFLHGVVLREWIIGVAAGVVNCVGLIDVLFIFREDRRCVHDMIASTRVIQLM